MRLRAAVVGVGYLGRFHAQKYASLRDQVELVGVCDSFGENALKVSKELGTQAFSNVADLIGKIDVATIATTTPAHYQVARTLLEAGVHVLIEKPITVSVSDAEELVALADRKKLTLQVGHIERFNPAFLELQGQAKNVQLVEAFRYAPFKARALDVDVATDLMIHDIDLATQLMGGPVEGVEAFGKSIMTGTLDVVHAVLYFGSGKQAQLSVNRCYPHAVRTVSAYSRETHLFADLGGATLTRIEKSNDGVDSQVLAVTKADALLEETKAFLSAVRGERPVLVSGQQGLDALRTLEKVLNAVRQ